MEGGLCHNWHHPLHMLGVAGVVGEQERGLNHVQQLLLAEILGERGLTLGLLLPVHHVKVEVGLEQQLGWPELPWVGDAVVLQAGLPTDIDVQVENSSKILIFLQNSSLL